MTNVRLVAVSAGLGKPSATRLLADRLVTAARERLERQGEEVEVRVIELRDLASDIANNLVTGFPGARLREAVEAVTGADALIAVTPVFTASYSGLFKSFFDVIEPDALTGKPVLVAATGGTARHSLVLDHAMRPLFGYLRALVVPTGVYAAAEDWGGAGDGLTATLPDRITRAAGELAAFTAAARQARPAGPAQTPAGDGAKEKEEAEVVPFEQLLASLRPGRG
ncbi:FMN reductase [Bailinhaonella thermotolerans]|uniref:Oxidoreductase n=1 Tax=Bailinhaonella thermotolerans TaxID=1070861 RepID=A0A3A4B367_9ACTN|nr:FMN reductase [Bailinhaonella thermotolerans]RJL32615.1 oxidoreductase [Bailinhaonella thermotolerans]